MKATINTIDEFERELEISIPWEMVKDEYNDLLKQYSKATLKGFRPGKAPLGAVESTFKNEIKEDLARACSTRFCRKALKDNNMEPGSPIEVLEILLNKGQQLTLRTRFVEMPSFELPDYFNLNIQSKEEEEVLNEISEKLLEQTNITVPPSLIENELNYSEPEEGSEEGTEIDVEAAEERVKLMLILKKIAAQDNIEVNNQEIEDRMKIVADENGIPVEQLKEYLVSNGGIARLSDVLLAESVLKYIISVQENN